MAPINNIIIMVGNCTRNVIVIHFGKNPSNGGIPLRDRRMIDNDIFLVIRFLLTLVKFEEAIFKYIIMNSGIVIIEYIIR